MKKVLHVGCGPATLIHLPFAFQNGDWQEVRFDIDPSCNPDILGTILEMREIESESMDALYSSHNIEHVHFHEIVGVLKEFKRVLKPDGFCVITCPDIESLAEAIAKGGLHEPLYEVPMGKITPNDIIYGHSASIASGQIHMAHKTGFDVLFLAHSLEDAGFAAHIGRRNPAHFNLWFLAFKKQIAETEMIETFRNYTMIGQQIM